LEIKKVDPQSLQGIKAVSRQRHNSFLLKVGSGGPGLSESDAGGLFLADPKNSRIVVQNTGYTPFTLFASSLMLDAEILPSEDVSVLIKKHFLCGIL
jgi:hypothetical protein